MADAVRGKLKIGVLAIQGSFREHMSGAKIITMTPFTMTPFRRFLNPSNSSLTIYHVVEAGQKVSSLHRFSWKDWCEYGYNYDAALKRCGVEVVEVRKSDDLAGLAGLVIPGGESTTMANIAERNGLVRAPRLICRKSTKDCAKDAHRSCSFTPLSLL